MNTFCLYISCKIYEYRLSKIDEKLLDITFYSKHVGDSCTRNMILRQEVSSRFVEVVYKRVSVIVPSSFTVILYYCKMQAFCQTTTNVCWLSCKYK